MEHFYQDIYPDYFSYPNLYKSFVEQAQDGDLLVEIGSFLGRSIAYLGVEAENAGKRLQIHCIDSWDPGNCNVWYTDADGSNYREYAGEGVYKLFLQNTKPLSKRIQSIRMTSVAASELYEDESIAFLFIDGDHSYEAVQQDLNFWYKKVKPGGIISGHDWESFDGVKRAVEEFPEIENADLLITENCWSYKKPKGEIEHIFSTGEHTPKRNFDHIYKNQLWGWEGNGSGTGSMMHTTVSVRELFERLMREQGVKKIVDVSVGGMEWWPEVLKKFPEVEFFGYDISSIKTAENIQRFSHHNNWKFYVGDVVEKADYPPCDLLICRHTLNHLSAEDVLRSIQNLTKADARMLGITHHEVDELHKEELIADGTIGCIDYRPIDLRKSLLNMSDPWMEIADADAEDVQMDWKRKFAIWKHH